MATYTTNLNLKKPAGTDAADIGDINDNMDKIDAGVVKKSQGSSKIGRFAGVDANGDIIAGNMTYTEISVTNANLKTRFSKSALTSAHVSVRPYIEYNGVIYEGYVDAESSLPTVSYVEGIAVVSSFYDADGRISLEIKGVDQYGADAPLNITANQTIAKYTGKLSVLSFT